MGAGVVVRSARTRLVNLLVVVVVTVKIEVEEGGGVLRRVNVVKASGKWVEVAEEQEEEGGGGNRVFIVGHIWRARATEVAVRLKNFGKYFGDIGGCEICYVDVNSHPLST